MQMRRHESPAECRMDTSHNRDGESRVSSKGVMMKSLKDPKENLKEGVSSHLFQDHPILLDLFRKADFFLRTTFPLRSARFGQIIRASHTSGWKKAPLLSQTTLLKSRTGNMVTEKLSSREHGERGRRRGKDGMWWARIGTGKDLVLLLRTHGTWMRGGRLVELWCGVCVRTS